MMQVELIHATGEHVKVEASAVEVWLRRGFRRAVEEPVAAPAVLHEPDAPTQEDAPTATGESNQEAESAQAAEAAEKQE